MSTTVADVMTRKVMAAREDAPFKEIVEVMRANRVSALPVLDSGNGVIGLIGIVSRLDVLSVYGHEIHGEIINRILIGGFALNPHAFEILVRAGIVTITGQAESKDVAAQLLDAIQRVEAVVAVRDRLSYPHDDQAGKTRLFAFNAFAPKA